jgi:nucleoside-diphosphate-sugar epimerase
MLAHSLGNPFNPQCQRRRASGARGAISTLTGWRPQVGAHEGVAATLEWADSLTH